MSDKTIIIKSLELKNFKGVRELKVQFNDHITSVAGRNGSGKTTLFDAFTYVLFGKDSKDRKDFNIKTLDENNQPIPKLPHEVECILSVDGEEMKLRRCYCEDWTKKRGSATEEFTGHHEERYFNDVPCSVKEYAAKVAAICDEGVFKFITNPLYFTAQKKDIQRTMLFRMAGGVSDAEIAKGNTDFETLLDKLTGKTLDEYKREVGAKKKRIKEAVESLPARIDERHRDMVEAEDWAQLEKELADCRKAQKDYDDSILDMAKKYEAEDESRKSIYTELTKVSGERMARKIELGNALMAEYNAWLIEYNDTKRKIDTTGHEISYVESDIRREEQNLATLNATREKLLDEWKAIKAEELKFSDDEFTCPTCGRKYEIEEIEARQQEMTERFQLKKAERLEANKLKGTAIKQKIMDSEARLVTLRSSLELKQAERQALSESPVMTRQMQKPEMPDVIDDKTYLDLCNRETDLRNQLDGTQGDRSDIEQARADRAHIQTEIDNLVNRLSKREAIRRNEERIAELEEELRNQQQALTELEGIEYTIAQFAKARVNAIEERVNAMFERVRFKMFEQQINGGELETCEAMVDGVPFSDLNNAGRINAGLDIINAICRFEGVYAPIFIDNAESVNDLQPVNSQTVRLFVTEDETLNII